jgi:hypothetical protein
MNEIDRREALTLAAAAGVAAAAAGEAAAQPNRPADRWRAWAVTRGDATKLVVEGIFSAGGPGTVALVTPAVPQGVNRKVLMLELKRATLPGIWPAILTPIPAHFTLAPYKNGQHESVEVR